MACGQGLPNEESEGPDFYTDYEFRVIDNHTGETVKQFAGSTGNGIGYSYVQGVKWVIISEDGTHLIVADEDDHESKIPL